MFVNSDRWNAARNEVNRSGEFGTLGERDRPRQCHHPLHRRPQHKSQKDSYHLETKTNQQGSVSIPEIPQGKITIQIIADNFQTFGSVYELNQPEQIISIKLNPPQAQYSEDVKSGDVKTRK